MASTPRPFNPEALRPFASAEARPRLGAGTLAVRRHSSLFPLARINADGTHRPSASSHDRTALATMLVEHFGGVTVPATVPTIRGPGARDPQHATQRQESNLHTYFLAYAAVHEASDRYSQAHERELEEALAEGVILIERQDVTIP